MEYELIHEIKNPCRGNQMRDVFFLEVECSDPERYVRKLLGSRITELTCENGPDGQITIHVNTDGLIQRFDFCPLPVNASANRQ